MHFHTFPRCQGRWPDARRRRRPLEAPADTGLHERFAAGTPLVPSGVVRAGEPTHLQTLRQDLLRVLPAGGRPTPKWFGSSQGDGEEDPEVREKSARLPDRWVARFAEEYLPLSGRTPYRSRREDREDSMVTDGRIPFFQVDAFTDEPFRGNPAGVCLLEASLPDSLLRAIASEINLSETAFVYRFSASAEGASGGQGGVWDGGSGSQAGTIPLRWFTPTVEVPLCGHATLAAAHVLLRERGWPSRVRFSTLSGVLAVEEEGDGWLRMDLPSDPPLPASPPPGLLEILGCPPGSPTFMGRKAYVIRLEDEERLRALKPDFGALVKVSLGPTALGVIVTAEGCGETDFVSRFFGPWVGVDEDPVTGMAHTLLGPLWAEILGKRRMLARQVSARGGLLRLELADDRVHLSGKAVTVLEGWLRGIQGPPRTEA